MLRRTAMVALAVAACAALAAPAALAQEGDDYSTTQVTYGDDVYGGTEESAGSGAESSSSGEGAWTKFITRLNGEAEIPGPGDANGSGTASVKARGTEVCYDVRWSGVDANASHIHKAVAGKAGPIVVNFFASQTPLEESRKTGCVEADAAVVSALAKNPAGYYVNVHSPQNPKGAIRGQLAKLDASGASLPYTGVSRTKGLLLLALCAAAAGSMLLAVGQRRRSVPVRR
jgi:hypothetical protein